VWWFWLYRLLIAAVIASRGIEVIGIDVSRGVIDTINQGKVHIIEPDLVMLVQERSI
jgi:UDP-N-acetyl-D-mannosaminuronic acid dehydrogenase